MRYLHRRVNVLFGESRRVVMNITVAEALTIYPLSQAKLVAGHKGTGRIIKSLNTMDAPDVSDWIKDGEMLFTTAYAIKDTPERFLAVLKKLNERGAAGIGIKLGRYWKEIPDVVLEHANRLAFPIMELPYEFTFSDQMNALFQADFKRNTMKLYDALDKQKHLMRLALQIQTHNEPYDEIASILNHSLYIIHAKGHIIYEYGEWSKELMTLDWPWAISYSHKRAEDNSWISKLPLMKNDNCYGFLVVRYAEWNQLKEEEALLYQAAEIISHFLEYTEDEQHTVANIQWGTLLERYIHRQISKDTFHEQVQYLGTTFPAGAVVCVLTTSIGDNKHNPVNADVLKLLQDFRKEIKYHLRLGTLDSLHHILFNNQLLSIFKVREATTVSNEAFIIMLLNSFNEIHRSMGHSILQSYISNVKPELYDIMDGYEECVEAKFVANSLHYSAHTIPFSDLEFTYLFRHIPRNVLQKYCDKLVLPLSNKDDEYKTYMLKTLESFVMNEGQINEIAKQLFIHRNTVIYRLEKISEMLELDLKKMSDLLKLKMFFMFKSILATNVAIDEDEYSE